MDRTLSLFSSSAGATLSTNNTLDTAPKTYPTTGFVSVYVWSGLDNASCFVILNEAALNHKSTFIWLIVFVAIACNMMASVSGFFLLDCLAFNLTPDPHICDSKAHVYYFLECVCYCTGFFLLFYRKLKVVPEKIGYPGAVDLVVLLGCCGLNLAADLFAKEKSITRPSEAGSRPTGASVVSKATPGNTALALNKSVI
ncbi:hypothetical protein CcCBS67573_g03954 [Chytriomyces confervae]|uniref:Uncharacterized protein n=1 Tax=Chytriomyces confervae TaxID=246404 RepID=A0A507FEX4_9FUNG|nr:hypothetical protein CcCBS67573_g03954 [Chytriomyces confervae]